MPKTVTKPWDPSGHLKSEEDMAAYLEAAFVKGDSNLVVAALGDIARATGMRQVARKAGLGRESLYKALSPAGNLEFATILSCGRPGPTTARGPGQRKTCCLTTQSSETIGI